MFNIDSFLKRFETLTIPDETVRKTVSRIVFEKLDISIDISRITMKNNVVYLETKPLIKNEIFLNKTQILLELEKELKNKAPKNIL